MTIEAQAPFEPLSLVGDIAYLWPSKVVDLSGWLPQAISVDGIELLVSPIKMYIQIGSGGALQEITSTITWTTTDPGAMIGTIATWSGTSISMGGTVRVDDDGLITYDITFTPGASQRTASLYMTMYFRSGLTQNLLRFPRLNEVGGNLGPAAQEYDEVGWTTSINDGGNSGLFHPRSLIVHDGKYGFQWACDNDANFGHPAWGSQSDSVMSVDPDQDSMTIEFIQGLTPASNSSAPFTYRFYMYPLPARPIVPYPYRINHGAGDTLRCANYDLRATEGTETEYEWMGSGVGRDNGSEHDWEVHKAESDALEIESAGYAIAQCYPNGDTTLPWDSAFKCAANVLSANGGFQNPPLTQYKRNGDGADYSLDPALLTNTTFVSRLVQRAKDMITTLGIGAIYYDVAQTRPQVRSTDVWGRTYYHYPHTELRNTMREIAAHYWSLGLKVMQHPQCDVLPMIHSPSCDIWNPGEEMRSAIEALVGDLPARKRYYSNLPDWQKRAEWCPNVFGFHGAFLPQLVYSATNSLTDYAATAAHEYLATDSVCGETLARGMGFMQSFSDGAVTKDLFEVLRDIEFEDATSFEPFDSPDYAASSTDADGKVSAWLFGTTRLILIVLNRSDTSKVIPVRLRRAMSGAQASILFATTGESNAEARLPYEAEIDGSGVDWEVGVSLRGFTIVEVTGVEPVEVGGGLKRISSEVTEMRRYG